MYKKEDVDCIAELRDVAFDIYIIINQLCSGRTCTDIILLLLLLLTILDAILYVSIYNLLS